MYSKIVSLLNLGRKSIGSIKSNLTHMYNGFVINDPSTPDLTTVAKIPTIGNLKYAIKDLNLEPKNDIERRSLNCHVVIGNCINFVQPMSKTSIKKWAAAPVLKVFPNAGSDLNAYYDRLSLKFFQYKSRNKTVYFADSADIVAHELGHALLDAMRPDFWSVQSLEIWGFHEAFSDIVALFNIMNYDVVLEKMLVETKGDISKSNVVSRLAEEVGVLIRNITQDSAYLPNALRDPAVENYKYVSPANLPKDAPNNKLASECHSFGRVFSNAWYQILVRLFNYNVKNKQDKMTALKNARDFAFSVLMQSIPSSPRTNNYYTAIAKNMVSISKAKNADQSKIIKEVFVEWKIIDPQDIKMLSNTSWKEVISNLNKNDEVVKTSKSSLVCLKRTKTLKLSELSDVSIMSDSDFEIEVPNDHFFEFDKNHNLIEEIVPNKEEIKISVASCLNLIQDSIGDEKMWNIKDKKLVRSYII